MVDVDNRAPGVYRQDVYPTPTPSFLTGVPVFLGYALGPEEPVVEPVEPAQPIDESAGGPEEPDGEPGEPVMLTLWPQFEKELGPAPPNGYLASAVRGFFENDGLLCYVIRLADDGSPTEELRRGLEVAGTLDDVDLVCAPDIMRTPAPTVDPDRATVTAMQRDVLDHCARRGDRFAILDAIPRDVDAQRLDLRGDHGALYHPWALVPGPVGLPRYVPPSGHIAGVYSRSDRNVGVHKAPANEVLEGVLDLQADIAAPDVGRLYATGVNCLRALPGRGIRVWGARTLSADPAWQHVNVRRVVLTLGRWLERFMAALVHEPNDVRLWVRIMRDLTAYLEGQFRRGALKGRTPDEAFFVKCDSETNPPEAIDAGTVVTHVGLAPVAPAEFVVVRIIHGASGVSITTTS